MTSDPEETSVTIQDVDRESMKYIKTERDDPSWAAQEGQLLVQASNIDLISGMRSTGTSMFIFVRGVGVGLTHTENLIIKTLRIARETGDLEAETGEESKKPDIGRVVESYFNLPNEYSSIIISSEFSEVVQIDHQKICMTDSGYNQVLVMIDHFTKYAEAVPCQTASAEETCDHLINTWIARHGCPKTTRAKDLRAYERADETLTGSSSSLNDIPPPDEWLVKRQNRALVSMLRVYCSRYMTDWDRYLPQVMGAYNSTQHSTIGVSPHMMLTGHEKSLPLTFFYPEYEGKKTSPQVYMRDVIRCQQELNDLCRKNTQQAQARQRKKFDKKAAGAKAYSVGDYVWVFQNIIPSKGTKKLLKSGGDRS